MRMQLTATRWEELPAVSRAYAANAGLAFDFGIPVFGATSVACGRVKPTHGKGPARRLSESTP